MSEANQGVDVQSSSTGRFIWYELITPDMAGAKRFYGDLLGWTAQDMPPMPGAERRFKPFVDFAHGAGWETEFVRMEWIGEQPNFDSTALFSQVDAQTAGKVVMGFSLGALAISSSALLACSKSGAVCCPSLHRDHTVGEVAELMQRTRCAAFIWQNGYGADADNLVVVIAHLSLSIKARIGTSGTYFTKFDQNFGANPVFSVLNTSGFNGVFPSSAMNVTAPDFAVIL